LVLASRFSQDVQLEGGDGDRLYYGGCAMIAQGSQFYMNYMEVMTSIVDLKEVRSHRVVSSQSMQAPATEKYNRIEVDFVLSGGIFDSIKDLEDLVLHD
jgi:NAD+ synthase (glutamine-hydrolysing)